MRERARLATIDAAQDERELQALVDFDLDLYTSFAAASVERDGALATMFDSGTGDVTPAQQALVTQRLRADSLRGLLQAEVPGSACAADDPATDPYSVEQAREWRTAQDPTFGAAGLPPASADRGAALAERHLMYAAVAFAAALLLLTAAGLAEPDPAGPGGRDGRRGTWVRLWRGLSWAALATGSVLVVLHVPLLTIALWLGVTGAALGARVPARDPGRSAPGVDRRRQAGALVGRAGRWDRVGRAGPRRARAVGGRRPRAVGPGPGRQAVRGRRAPPGGGRAGSPARPGDVRRAGRAGRARAAAANQDAGATQEADRIVRGPRRRRRPCRGRGRPVRRGPERGRRSRPGRHLPGGGAAPPPRLRCAAHRRMDRCTDLQRSPRCQPPGRRGVCRAGRAVPGRGGRLVGAGRDADGRAGRARSRRVPAGPRRRSRAHRGSGALAPEPRRRRRRRGRRRRAVRPRLRPGRPRRAGSVDPHRLRGGRRRRRDRSGS